MQTLLGFISKHFEDKRASSRSDRQGEGRDEIVGASFAGAWAWLCLAGQP